VYNVNMRKKVIKKLSQSDCTNIISLNSLWQLVYWVWCTITMSSSDLGSFVLFLLKVYIIFFLDLKRLFTSIYS